MLLPVPSEKDIHRFQQLYLEHFGVSLEEAESRETFTKLLTLYATLLASAQPMSVSSAPLTGLSSVPPNLPKPHTHLLVTPHNDLPKVSYNGFPEAQKTDTLF
jgi:hypothetical protein